MRLHICRHKLCKLTKEKLLHYKKGVWPMRSYLDHFNDLKFKIKINKKDATNRQKELIVLARANIVGHF